jgi:DNA helicase-2/ATP-dependent DNA helicase PcrA
MSWDDGLTGTARHIAATPDTPLRVMAGPGTGKSFALKRRVARLLEDGVQPGRVLAVTFTRTAARLLVDDLRSIGAPGADLVGAGTLHGYCFSLLSREPVLAAIGRIPRPVVTFNKAGSMQFEGAPMLADIRETGPFGSQREASARVRAFEAAWARLESETPGWPIDITDRQFHLALEGWLRFHRAMLIGELVPVALRYLRANPMAPERAAYDHVLVDEYQDLNRAEQDLVDLLAGAGATAIVGDVDQSIYRFRHANPDGITGYAARHPATHDEVLYECLRCPTTVVEMADSLIRVNHPGVAGSVLHPKPGNPPGDVAIVQWLSLDAEVSGTANAVWRLIHDRGYQPGDVLVLTPRREIGYRIRNRLRAMTVDVHSFYHEESLEARPAQQSFCLLTLLARPDDPVALRWWLGDGDATWRAGAYAGVRAHAEATGQPIGDILQDVIDGRLSLPRTRALTARHADLTRQLATLRAASIADLVDRLFPDGDDDFLALREAALSGLAATTEIAGLFERLRNQITQPEMPDSGDFVRVMSLHKSKGLTSKVVIVAGCIEGLVPTLDGRAPVAEQAAALAEQRRLFYVAMTRCTEVLVLSSAVRIDRAFAWRIRAEVPRGRGPVAATIASRFFDELGPTAPGAVGGAGWPLARDP